MLCLLASYAVVVKFLPRFNCKELSLKIAAFFLIYLLLFM